jgi:hypothetical protein
LKIKFARAKFIKDNQIMLITVVVPPSTELAVIGTQAGPQSSHQVVPQRGLPKVGGCCNPELFLLESPALLDISNQPVHNGESPLRGTFRRDQGQGPLFLRDFQLSITLLDPGRYCFCISQTNWKGAFTSPHVVEAPFVNPDGLMGKLHIAILLAFLAL